MIERRYVVRDFLNIGERDARRFVVFKEKQIGQGGLRSLDLGRKHRFLADVGVDEERQVRQDGSQAVEAAKQEIGLPLSVLASYQGAALAFTAELPGQAALVPCLPVIRTVGNPAPVAALLVAVPALLVTTHLKLDPLSVVAAAGVV